MPKEVSYRLEVLSTGQQPLPVRLRPQAHQRRCQRKARLHDRRVHRRATHPWKVGLRTMRNVDPGSSTGARHR